MYVWRSAAVFLGAVIASAGILFSNIESAQATPPLNTTFSATAPTETLGTIRHLRVDPSDGKVYVLGNSTDILGVISADGSSFTTITYGTSLPTHSSSDLAVSQGRLFIVTSGGSSGNAVYRYDVSGSDAALVAVHALNAGTGAIAFDADSETLYASKSVSVRAFDTDLNQIGSTTTLSLIPTRLTYEGGALFYLSTTGRFQRAVLGVSDTLITTGGPTSVTVKGLVASGDGSALYYASTNAFSKLAVASGMVLWSKAGSNIAGMDVSSSTGRITIINSSGTVATYDPITSPSSISSSASGTSAVLTWTTGVADGDFNGVTIRRSTSSYPTTATDGVAVTSSSLATSFIDTELDEGTYYYSFFNETSDGYYSSPATSTATIDLPPAAPTLTAEATGSNISLSWSVPSDTASFTLRRSMSDYPTSHTDGAAVTTTNSSITSLTESGMMDGDYFYSIFAADAGGNYSTSGTASVTVDTTGPTTPILSATASGSSILLTWDMPATTVLFLLRRSTSDYPATISSGTGVTSTTDTTLVQTNLDDGPYYYSTFARDSYGNYSNAGTASTTIDTTAPTAPSSFSAAASGNTINLTWVNPVDVDFSSSTIRRSTTSFPSSITDGSAVTNTMATSYADATLADGTYYYSIFALDTAGNPSVRATSSATVDTHVAPAASGGGGIGASFVPPSAINAAPLSFSVVNGSGMNVAKTVSSPTITLKLNANPATVRGYAVSFDPLFRNANLLALPSTQEIVVTLPQKKGTYPVYLKYYSTNGQSSDVIVKTITYLPQPSTMAETSGSRSILASVQQTLKPLLPEKNGLHGHKNAWVAKRTTVRSCSLMLWSAWI